MSAQNTSHAFAWGLCCWPSFCLEPSCPSYLSLSSFSSSTSLSKWCLKIATFSASHPFFPSHTRILLCVFFSVSKAPFSLWPNMKSCVGRSVVSHSLCDPVDCSPPGSSSWNSPGKNTGMGSHSLLQGIFPTQGSNLGLPHCRQGLYHLSHQEHHMELLLLDQHRRWRCKHSTRARSN